MYPVKYCPRAMENLFCITAALSTSSKLQSNDANNIQLAQSNGTMLTFDRQIKTHNGWVAGVEIIPIKHDVGANTKETKKKTQISISMKTYVCMKNMNDQLRELGHPSEATTRAMGASMGIKVVGKFESVKLASWEKQSKET